MITEEDSVSSQSLDSTQLQSLKSDKSKSAKKSSILSSKVRTSTILGSKVNVASTIYDAQSEVTKQSAGKPYDILDRKERKDLNLRLARIMKESTALKNEIMA